MDFYRAFLVIRRKTCGELYPTERVYFGMLYLFHQIQTYNL